MKSLNIRKKLVTLAVASAVSGGAMMAMTAPVHAMNVSQNNMGEVLLFPYYTVKNGYDTVFTVTNTSDKTAVFKIRWREALNSREVRDFNVVLSPFDHWSGAVTIDAASGGALFRTFDKTCTAPRLPGMETTALRAAAGSKGEIAFTNTLFTGSLADTGSEFITRVQEGYFEVILMGVSDRSTTNSANTLEFNAKHVNNVPRDCTLVDNLFLNSTANLGYMAAPVNILKGHVTYINVANGTAVDAEPTAIENFVSTNIVFDPGNALPDLSTGDSGQTALFLSDGVPYFPVVAGSSFNAVSRLLTASSVINEFATGAGAATSWVLTFPTKHHYTDNTGPVAPFSEMFQGGTFLAPSATVGLGRSCDDISMTLYNREEATIVEVGQTQFSPISAPGANAALCHEVNVLNFNASNVFGAGIPNGVNPTNRLTVNTSGVGTAGWAELKFSEAPATTFGGLPVIGFAAVVRDAGGAAVNYGSNIEHAMRVRGVTTVNGVNVVNP